MSLAQSLEAGLELAHASRFRFQLETDLLHFTGEPPTLIDSLLLAQQPQQLLCELERAFQLWLASGDLCLRVQVFDLLGELENDVIHARQVFARIGEA